MKYPDSPYCVLGFYFARIEDSEAFAKVLHSVLQSGAKLTGEVLVHSHTNKDNFKFAAPSDLFVEERQLRPPAKDFLQDLLDNVTLRVMEVGFSGAVGVKRDGPEKLAYAPVSPSAAASDNHPILVQTTGWMFTGGPESTFAKEQKRAGKIIYKTFVDLVNRLEPDYANISFDWDLECPTDLKVRPSYLSFCNFYVSDHFMKPSNLSALDELFRSAFVQRLSYGKYYSTCAHLNPDCRHVDNGQAQVLSEKVAKRVARCAGLR